MKHVLRRLLALIAAFQREETAAGFLLMASAALALVLANWMAVCKPKRWALQAATAMVPEGLLGRQCGMAGSLCQRRAEDIEKLMPISTRPPVLEHRQHTPHYPAELNLPCWIGHDLANIFQSEGTGVWDMWTFHSL